VGLDFDLSQEQAMIRKLAREFADEVVAPGAGARDKSGEFPVDLVKQLGDLGLLGIPYAEEYGGMGGDTVSYALAVEELSRADASLGITVAAHCSIGMGPVYYFGTEEQKQRWLPAAARGESLASFGLTEPGAGSDSAGTKTTAVAQGDAWVLNGSKQYITNAYYCGYIVCTAVTDPSKGHKGISAFIVPNPTEGFSVGPGYDKMGLHASDTRPLYFDNVRIPRENLLGNPGEASSSS
jgi:alkylation response protein AidB-like acyl-CoA dehydrogenase